jgi:nucleoside-diphosphate-sugar epimerase
MTRVLVTGGGGFLGKAIVRQLVSRGFDVASFSRQSHAPLEPLGVRQILGDLRNPEAVRMACRGMDIVFHVAAKAGVWGKPRDFYDINFHGTQNIIDACQRSGVGRLVYTSSPSVVFNGRDMAGVNESCPYPKRHRVPYPASKALAEKAVMAAGKKDLATISLRPHLIWGPEDNHLAPRILSRARQLRIVGRGENKVDTTYVDNAADAHLLAADALARNPELSGSVYFISQGQPIGLWDMVNAILKAGGIPPVTRKIPYSAAWCVGCLLEAIHTLLGLKAEPRMTRFVANELATSHWFDISASRTQLGYSPRVSTPEGLRRLSLWLETDGLG